MFHPMKRTMYWLFVASLALLTACSTATEPTATPVPTPVPTEVSAPTGRLDVTVLYPSEASEMEMGRSTRFIVQVTDAQGKAVADAQVAVVVKNPEGEIVASLPALHGSEGIYRTAAWTLPHRTLEGPWGLRVEARSDRAQGGCVSSFQVKNSTSEVLLAKYGFWIDAPKLRAAPQLLVEKGDARNGMIHWGGNVVGLHSMPLNYVDVHWREGHYSLEDAEAARRFMLGGVGDLENIRSLGPIQPLQFKHWPAWRMGCRGEFKENEIESVVFYAPEVDKTYAIITTLALPPRNIPDPHARLRDSFAIFPNVHATGVASKPLPRLLPGPELIGPPLAARFQGVEQPIILQWKPVKDLDEGEYYEVTVDYWYREAHPTVRFVTRETQLTLPETLYHSPNCAVFNWRVTLKCQTGLEDDGQPVGESLSYSSLYWYLWWQHPPGQAEFPVLCPYTHLE